MVRDVSILFHDTMIAFSSKISKGFVWTGKERGYFIFALLQLGFLKRMPYFDEKKMKILMVLFMKFEDVSFE